LYFCVGERHFIINTGSGADNIGNMTRKRAKAFMQTYTGTLKPSKAACHGDIDALEKVLKKSHSCHLVTAQPVELKHANPFLRTIAKLNGIGADGSDEDADEPLPSWKFTCSCGHFWHNGNLCSHIGAVADTVGAIDLAVLVTKLAGRKLPGRPKKNLGGPLDRVKSTAAEKYASPEWFEAHIEKKGAMCVHKHRTVRLFGETGKVYVGKVMSYRELNGKGLKKHGLWEIRYEDDSDPEDDKEELTLQELCAALSYASDLGMRGAAAQDLAQRVI